MAVDWDSWKKKSKKNFFVKDGVINEGLYKASKLRVLMLLKETPIDGTKGGFNIVEDLEERFRKNENHALHDKIYISLAYRVYAIASKIEGKEPQPFSEIKSPAIQNYRFSQYFRSSAYINIRKYDGKLKSNDIDLREVALEDRCFLMKQIDELQPKIILCNSTFKAYKVVYKDDSIRQIDDTLFFIHKRNGEERLIYAGYHPTQRRYSEEEIYGSLCRDLNNNEVLSWMDKNQRTI